MEEFCLDCYNARYHSKYKQGQVIQTSSKDLEECSHCGRYGRVIVQIPPATPWGFFRCKYWRLRDLMGI